MSAPPSWEGDYGLLIHYKFPWSALQVCFAGFLVQMYVKAASHHIIQSGAP
jgi:hypothetical protein